MPICYSDILYLTYEISCFKAKDLHSSSEKLLKYLSKVEDELYSHTKLPQDDFQLQVRPFLTKRVIKFNFIINHNTVITLNAT